jgi:hypothetical protein
MASVTQRFPRSARRFSRTVKHVSTLSQTVAAIFQRGAPGFGPMRWVTVIRTRPA